MSVTLDESDVIRELYAAVADRGEDYVYIADEHGCAYLTQYGTPSCIVGVVLTRLGVPTSAFARKNTCRISGIWADLVNDHLVVPPTPRIRQLLDRVQRLQDSKKPWGEAVHIAVAEMNR